MMLGSIKWFCLVLFVSLAAIGCSVESSPNSESDRDSASSEIADDEPKPALADANQDDGVATTPTSQSTEAPNESSDSTQQPYTLPELSETERELIDLVAAHQERTGEMRDPEKLWSKIASLANTQDLVSANEAIGQEFNERYDISAEEALSQVERTFELFEIFKSNGKLTDQWRSRIASNSVMYLGVHWVRKRKEELDGRPTTPEETQRYTEVLATVLERHKSHVALTPAD